MQTIQLRGRPGRDRVVNLRALRFGERRGSEGVHRPLQRFERDAVETDQRGVDPVERSPRHQANDSHLFPKQYSAVAVRTYMRPSEIAGVA